MVDDSDKASIAKFEKAELDDTTMQPRELNDAGEIREMSASNVHPMQLNDRGETRKMNADVRATELAGAPPPELPVPAVELPANGRSWASGSVR